MCLIQTHMHHVPYARTLTRIQEPPLLAHDRTSSAGAICHAVCPTWDHTRLVPYAHTLTHTRNRKGRL
jgi:hypothetical protein